MKPNKHIANITPAHLLEAGYKDAGKSSLKPDVVFSCYKGIRDETGKLYTIHVDVWDFIKFPHCDWRYNYDFRVQYERGTSSLNVSNGVVNDGDSLPIFTASMGVRSDEPLSKIEEIEKGFNDIWKLIGSPYHETF